MAPTESDDVLLQLTAEGMPKETLLETPLNWVGSRHFTMAHKAEKWRLTPTRKLFERPGQFMPQGADAA
ncbi:MAG: hypothetical protein ACTH6C_12295 [Halomonas sp.]